MIAAEATTAAVNRLAGIGLRVGLRTSAVEAMTSLDPADYVYPSKPTQQQRQFLLEQMSAICTGHGSASMRPHGTQAGFASVGGLKYAAGFMSAPAIRDPAATSSSKPDLGPGLGDPHPGHIHGLALDLEDDCLRLLLGEDGEGSAAASPRAAGRPAGTRRGADAGGDDDDACLLIADAAAASRRSSTVVQLDSELLSMRRCCTPLPPAAGGDAGNVSPGGAQGGHTNSSNSSAGTTCAASDVAAAAHGDGDNAHGEGMRRVPSDHLMSAGQGAAARHSPAAGAERSLLLTMDYAGAVESLNFLLATDRKAPLPRVSDYSPLVSPAPNALVLEQLLSSPADGVGAAAAKDQVVQSSIKRKRR